MTYITNKFMIQRLQQELKTRKVSNQTQKIEQSVSDTVSLSSKNINTINEINILQKNYFSNQQLFGVLTILENALELFQSQPNIYKEHLETTLSNAKKDFSQLVDLLQESATAENLSSEVKKIKTHTIDQLSMQKKAIASYIISSQNKDSLPSKIFNSNSSSKLSQIQAHNQIKNINELLASDHSQK